MWNTTEDVRDFYFFQGKKGVKAFGKLITLCCFQNEKEQTLKLETSTAVSKSRKRKHFVGAKTQGICNKPDADSLLI